MCEAAILARLRAVAGVTALLGAGASMRVYAQAAPPKCVTPYATYTRISTNTEPAASLEGGRPQVAWSRIQFEAWSKKYAEAKAVEDALRLALDGWGDTLAGVTVNSCRRIDARDLYEPDTNPPLHRAGADYLVCFNL